MARIQFSLLMMVLLVIVIWQSDVVHAQFTDDNNKPLYEEQLAVWPQDYDDLSAQQIPFDEEFIHFQPVALPATTTTTTTTTPRPVYRPPSTPRPVYRPPSTPRPVYTPPSIPTPTLEAGVHIVHSTHVVHANGTHEDKLLLSNGVVNYKRTYQKMIAGQLVPVQEGFSSVPVAEQRGKFHTQFYIADENGNRVYKVTHGSRRPQLQHYWHYKGQMKTNKLHLMTAPPK